jgi:cell division septation protein DedD
MEVQMSRFTRIQKGHVLKMSALGAIMLGGLLTASATMAQVSGRPAPAMPCPNPTVQTIPMTVPTVFNGDFSAANLAAPRAGINDPAPNKVFLHTFRWDPPACCRIMAATLTVVTRANQAGASATSNDAGNDAIGLGLNGSSIPGMSAPLYSGPVTINQQTTKTFVLNAAALAAMNANNRLSFAVQDDSRVVSANLRIERCCIR